MKRAIKNHLGDFIAICVLVVLAIVVSGYVLSHERLQLPFIGTSQFTLNAEFQTGQAVTPGQGQTVRVSGVQIGDIGGHRNPPLLNSPARLAPSRTPSAPSPPRGRPFSFRNALRGVDTVVPSRSEERR